MKKYYWSIEDGRVISIEELEKIRSELYPNDSMEKFLEDCSCRNNGDLEPLCMEIKRQEKLIDSLMDDIRTAQRFVTYLKRLESEG